MNKPLKTLFYLFVLIIVLYSCKSGERNDLRVLDKLNKSLEASAHNIDNNTITICKAFEDKLAKPGTAEKAKIWNKEILFIKEQSKSILKYIDSLSDELYPDRSDTSVMSISKTDIGIKILSREKQANRLLEKLREFKNNILFSDPQLNQTFKDNFPIYLPFSENNGGAELYDRYFKNTSLMSVLAMLNSLKLDIILAENQTITFCFFQIGSTDGDGFMTQIGFLIGQSASHIKPNEILEISAGIGAYSTAAHPVITINGKKVLCENGVAEYKFKGSDKPGKHFVPVKIQYTNENGEHKITQQQIQYTVDE